MAKLKFDEAGKRFYETGVSDVVLFVKDSSGYGEGVAWNGVTGVTQSPSGAEPTALYADNIKYLNLISVEEFAATIEAYTYPDAFAVCDGSAAIDSDFPGVVLGQQPRKSFALAYKTKVGTDEDSEKGFKFHVIYGCFAAPSERSYATVNDSPEAITFSWSISTTPVEVVDKDGTDLGFKPTAYVEIDSTKFTTTNLGKLTTILNKFYGTDPVGSGEGTAPTLLLPGEIYDILNAQ